jgi:hypothetical protein
VTVRSAFDVNRLQVGSPAPLLDGVSGSAALVNFGSSESGTLAYMPTDDREVGTATLVCVDRKGAEQPVAAPARIYEPRMPALRLSAAPTGLSLASETTSQAKPERRGFPPRLARLLP